MVWNAVITWGKGVSLKCYNWSQFCGVYMFSLLGKSNPAMNTFIQYLLFKEILSPIFIRHTEAKWIFHETILFIKYFNPLWNVTDCKGSVCDIRIKHNMKIIFFQNGSCCSVLLFLIVLFKFFMNITRGVWLLFCESYP